MAGTTRGLLADRSTVVMGAGSGVGRASALRFAGEGARVVVADLDVERAGETVRLVEAAGGAAVAVRCDVSQEADVVAALDLAASTYGRLDVVFNNVGVPTPRLGMSFTDHTVDDFDRLFAINARGVFLGSKHAFLRFREQDERGEGQAEGQSGVILNTGSVAGLVAWGGSVYGATKGAVHQLTRAIAIEGAPFGIRCNAICPAGMPYTNFTAAGGLEVSGDALEAVAEGVASMHPLGRPILAEDCADAALYLVSDLSRNVTGVLLPVDGGYVAR
jgi:NAD(P)-dependent dehydrogenase (short-subunit alcohol dehydrogenase family)